MGKDLLGPSLDLICHPLHVGRTPQRVCYPGHTRLVGDDLLGTQGGACRLLARQRQGLVVAVRVEALGATQHAGQGLKCHPRDVGLRLLRGKGHSGCLGVEAQLEAALIDCAVAFAQPPGPDPSGSPELAYLLEEVDMAVEEEAEAGCKVVDMEAGCDSGLDVGETVCKGERQLLHGRGASLPDVVAGDRHRVPAGHLGGGEPDHVGDEANRWPGREDVLLLRLVLLEDVVLEGSRQLPPVDTTLFGDNHVHGQQDRGRSVDGHRGGHPTQVDVGEEVGHVLNGVDGHPRPADLSQ